jgi:hypothetical protein
MGKENFLKPNLFEMKKFFNHPSWFCWRHDILPTGHFSNEHFFTFFPYPLLEAGFEHLILVL